jgi:receptor-type tyrosine-protein phosphatase gamma
MMARALSSLVRCKFSTVASAAHHKVSRRHVPVMLNETLEYLNPSENEVFIDMTFGAGGHTKRILESAPNVKVFALDRDPTAHKLAIELSEEYPNRLVPLLGRFSELPNLLNDHNVKYNSIDGILFDFGCSSMQFDEAARGFSIKKNSYLDMRMDQNRFPNQPTAADVLSRINEYDLARILKIYGDEKYYKKIAKAIVDTRYSVKKIETTKELADIVDAVCGSEIRTDMLDRPQSNATKTFQALRIFVNNELNEINYGILLAERYLKIGGRLVTLTFHSLEDTIVKRHLMGNISDDMANEVPLKYISHIMCHDQQTVESLHETNWMQLHKHVIVPKYEEIEENPRSRSAKLRAAIKLSG